MSALRTKPLSAIGFVRSSLSRTSAACLAMRVARSRRCLEGRFYLCARSAEKAHNGSSARHLPAVRPSDAAPRCLRSCPHPPPPHPAYAVVQRPAVAPRAPARPLRAPFSTSPTSNPVRQGTRCQCALSDSLTLCVVPKIKKIAAYIVQSDESGADYHRQKEGHWIVDSPISNPMSVYEQYRKSRLRCAAVSSPSLTDEAGASTRSGQWSSKLRSRMARLVSALVLVQLSFPQAPPASHVAEGGDPACFIIEKHLNRFVEGQVRPHATRHSYSLRTGSP